MKRKLSKTLLASIALASVGAFFVSPVYASTNYQKNVKIGQGYTTVGAHSVAINEPSINAEIQGHPYSAIVVDGKTMVIWTALNGFNTPYDYKGNGLFDIAGHLVQGIIYKGDTYLDWTSLAKPSVIANHIDGGWNFTRKWDDQSSDGYKMVVTVQKTQAEPFEWIPIWVQTFKYDGSIVKNQIVKVDELPLQQGFGEGITRDYDGDNGTLFSEVATNGIEGTQKTVVTWTDPNGLTHTQEVDITFKNRESTTTPTPPDDQVVATIPCVTSNYQVTFDGTSNGLPMHWQLDTGAMTPLINASDASRLHLPDLQDITVSGVTGDSKAYISRMNIVLGGVTFNNVTVVVDEAFTGTSLFGYSFFADNKYDLLVSYKHNTISILK